MKKDDKKDLNYIYLLVIQLTYIILTSLFIYII